MPNLGRNTKILVASIALVLIPLVYVWYVRPGDTVAPPPLAQVQDPLWEAPNFSLVNYDGRAISKADLAGKVWLAAFIFTRCPGPCPLISQRMSEAGKKLEGVGDFRMVSFTVDPKYDTPAVLGEYAKIWKADPEQWYFLTGAEPSDQAMFDLAKAFKIAAARSVPEGGEDPDLPDITHGTNILLVDQSGWVRSVYDSTDPDCPDWIAKGALELIHGRRLADHLASPDQRRRKATTKAAKRRESGSVGLLHDHRQAPVSLAPESGVSASAVWAGGHPIHVGQESFRVRRAA